MIDFQVGDKVKVLPFYLERYAGLDRYQDKFADVVKVKNKTVNHNDLSVESGDRSRFVSKYGKMDVYPLVELWIKYPDDGNIYIVSHFGYDK